jgi:DNA sulfur modification protein DndC
MTAKRRTDARDSESVTLEKLRGTLRDMADEYRADHSLPWIVGYSGGKDSTLLLQFVFEMLLDLPPSARRRPVHVVTNDTLVESPLIIEHVDKMLRRLEDAAGSLGLPITVAKTTPEVDQTFWVNLIGRGYPAPNRMFRWCTDRMKIQPTSNYIRKQVAASGKVILLIGVRRDESSMRAASVDRYDNGGQRLNPHNDLPNCLVYRPIVHFTTEEVWALLFQRPPPWGGTHRDLVTLYKNAEGGECPLVLEKSQAPSCGTSSSRFGCWTCTVVEKDRSMEGFIESGHEEMEPLLEFRDWLAEIRNDRSRRMMERRNGQVTYMNDGALVPGPFTLVAREELLRELLSLQEKVGRQLISPEEIERIRSIWAEDAAETTRRIVRLAVTEGDG